MKDRINFHQIADSLFEGVVVVDAKGQITSWNKGAERITGHPSSKMMGAPYQSCPAKHLAANGRELPAETISLLLTLKDGQPREALAYLSHSEGYRVSVIERAIPIKDERGKVTGGMAVFSNNKSVIASFQLNQKTEETVLFDPLTGIGNRPHIEMKIRSAIERFEQTQIPFGVLFIDIDHFKDFNDRHGHLMGDKILRVVANTLRQNLRVTDSCGRWGGEEFLALVLDINADGLTMVADKLRVLASQACIEEDGKKLSVTISIGATVVNENDTLQTLLQRADELLYKSKQKGRNCVTVGE